MRCSIPYLRKVSHLPLVVAVVLIGCTPAQDIEFSDTQASNPGDAINPATASTLVHYSVALHDSNGNVDQREDRAFWSSGWNEWSDVVLDHSNKSTDRVGFISKNVGGQLVRGFLETDAIPSSDVPLRLDLVRDFPNRGVVVADDRAAPRSDLPSIRDGHLPRVEQLPSPAHGRLAPDHIMNPMFANEWPAESPFRPATIDELEELMVLPFDVSIGDAAHRLGIHPDLLSLSSYVERNCDDAGYDSPACEAWVSVYLHDQEIPVHVVWQSFDGTTTTLVASEVDLAAEAP